MYKISLTTRMYKDRDVNIIGLGTNQYFVDDEEMEISLKILYFLKIPKCNKEVQEFLNINDNYLNIFNKLVKKRIITSFEEVFHEENSIYFKNKLYIDSIYENTDFILKNFKKHKFIILGTGGIGNYIAYALNTYNIKEMILFDGDLIELSNLNRQILFKLKDVDKCKVTCLKNELYKRNEKNKITTILEFANKVNLENLIKKIGAENTFIILSGDSNGILEDVTEIAVKYEIPFLNIGYLNDISVIGPFYIPRISSCPLCHNTLKVKSEMIFKENDSIKGINDIYTAPSSFINNAMASSMAMVDIIAYMSGMYQKINSYNKRIGISNKTFEKLEIITKIDSSCICSVGDSK